MKPILSVLFLLFAQVFCSPVPDKQKVLINQKQEGGWNIRADLKNFVFLIIPKSSPESDGTSPSPSPLGFFRSHAKHHGHQDKSTAQKQASVEKNEVGAETLHFIESKTAPYHVDIGKSDSHLLNDEILATKTPPVAIALKANEDKTKTPEDQAEKVLRQLRSTRFAKAFVLTVPEEDFVLTRMEEDKKVVKKDGLKNKSKKVKKEEMTLLGASEQCGPEMYRDVDGICRLRKLPISESKESTERDE